MDPIRRFDGVIVGVTAWLLAIGPLLAADITEIKTPGGVRFGLRGEKPADPGPALFVLASSIEETLGNEAYAKVGSLLAADGVLLASLDVPCHGQNTKPDEPSGLGGWRYRLERDDDFVADFTRQISEVADYLVAEGFGGIL